MDIETFLDRLILREGGYSNRPSDRGGATKFGITLKTLRNWRKDQALSAADIEKLTIEEAKEIYRDLYIAPLQLEHFDSQMVGELMFDCAVLHGVSQAGIWLQRALDVEADGRIGPITLKALAFYAPHDRLVVEITKQRLILMAELVEHDYSQAEYIKGWVRRAVSFL